MWVVVRPMHQAAEIIPLIHATKLDAVAHTQWHAPDEVDIVRNQQRVSVGQLYDESLMARIVVIVGQQTNDAT